MNEKLVGDSHSKLYTYKENALSLLYLGFALGIGMLFAILIAFKMLIKFAIGAAEVTWEIVKSLIKSFD